MITSDKYKDTVHLFIYFNYWLIDWLFIHYIFEDSLELTDNWVILSNQIQPTTNLPRESWQYTECPFWSPSIKATYCYSVNDCMTSGAHRNQVFIILFRYCKKPSSRVDVFLSKLAQPRLFFKFKLIICLN